MHIKKEKRIRTNCECKTASKMLLGGQFTIAVVSEPREKDIVVISRVLENDVPFSVIRKACCPTHDCNQFSDGNVFLTEGPLHTPCSVTRLVTLYDTSPSAHH